MGTETFRTIRERGGFGCPFWGYNGVLPPPTPPCTGGEMGTRCLLYSLKVFSMMKTFRIFGESFNYNENGEYKI